jgi:hypothetical protein
LRNTNSEDEKENNGNGNNLKTKSKKRHTAGSSNVINSVLNSEISKSLFKTSNKRKFGELDKPLTLIPFNSLESEIKPEIGNNNYLNENNFNSNGQNTFSPGNFMTTNGNLNSNFNMNMNNLKNNSSVTSNQSDYNY